MSYLPILRCLFKGTLNLWNTNYVTSGRTSFPRIWLCIICNIFGYLELKYIASFITFSLFIMWQLRVFNTTDICRWLKLKKNLKNMFHVVKRIHYTRTWVKVASIYKMFASQFCQEGFLSTYEVRMIFWTHG